MDDQNNLPQIKITGTVTDNQMKPLLGAIVKNEDKAALVDFFGKYSIMVKDTDAVLTFRYMGYENKEIKVGNKTIIDVSLMKLP